MKKLLLGMTLAAGAAMAPLYAQNDAEPEQPKWVVEFNNLPEQKREAFASGFRDASRMFEQKRVFEALQNLQKIEDIFKDHPQLMNLMGACYVEFRSFEEAKKHFNRALELSPGNLSVRFNMAEIEFVRGNWAECMKQFGKIVGEMPNKDSSSAQLCHFKMYICALKTNNQEEAKRLANLHEEFEDTPYYYVVKAVGAFEEGNDEEAQTWLRSANTVYGRHQAKSRDLTAFKDAMIESGYLQSFYGSEHNEAAEAGE